MLAAIERFTCSTSLGPQEFVIPGLGWVPGLMLIYGAHWNGAEGVLDDHAVVLGGATDGDSEWTSFNFERNGRNPSENWRQFRDEGCIVFSGETTNNQDGRASGVGDGIGSNPGKILNGWRVEWLGPLGIAHDIIVVFLGGDDLKVNCGVGVVPAAQDGTETVVMDASSGDGQFLPHGLVVVDPRRPINGVSTGITTAQGWVNFKNSVQISQYIGSQTAVTPSDAAMRNSSTRGIVSIPATNPHAGVAYNLNFDNASSTGWDVTAEDSAPGANRHYGYVAFNVDVGNLYMGIIDAPNSPSIDWEVTEIDFEPLIALVIANGSIIANDTSAQGASFSVGATDFTRHRSMGGGIQHDVAVSNAYNRMRDEFITCPNPTDGTEIYRLDNPVATPTGIRVAAADITAAAGGHKWLLFAIGVSTPPEPAPDRRRRVIVRPRPEPKTKDIIEDLEAESRARTAAMQARIRAEEAAARQRRIQRDDEEMIMLMRLFAQRNRNLH